MARDFTLDAYKTLLQAAIKAGYKLTSYEDYILNANTGGKFFILRHDVDDLPLNSLATALLEKNLGAKGSHYFRIVKQSLHPDVIKKIAAAGHEIGYHYEDVALCRGNMNKAFDDFKEHLEIIKTYYPVKTICMHGSPMSKWDNRLLWKENSYKELGIIGEPYFDLDFNKVLYITDTGRNWNKTESSVRDKVKTEFRFSFSSTFDIIKALEEKKMPDHIMLNIHPQRWTNSYVLWFKELVFQNLKNVIKKIVVKSK
jgi:hypothetical protein